MIYPVSAVSLMFLLGAQTFLPVEGKDQKPAVCELPSSPQTGNSEQPALCQLPTPTLCPIQQPRNVVVERQMPAPSDLPVPTPVVDRNAGLIAPSGKFPLQNEWGFFLFGEALYWKAEQEGLEYVAVDKGSLNVNQNAESSSPYLVMQNDLDSNRSKVNNPDFEWDWGFRVGFGKNLPHCDKWDFVASWTRFFSKAHGKQYVPTPSDLATNANNLWNAEVNGSTYPVEFSTNFPSLTALLSNVDVADAFIPADGSDIQFPLFINEATTDWNLHLNIFDLDIGRKFYMGRYLAFRPYLGLRGATIHQNYHVNYNQDPLLFNDFVPTPDNTTITYLPVVNQFNDDILLKADFDGIGILAGFEPQLRLYDELSIYGNFAFSLLYGPMKLKREESTLASINLPQTVTDYCEISGTGYCCPAGSACSSSCAVATCESSGYVQCGGKPPQCKGPLIACMTSMMNCACITPSCLSQTDFYAAQSLTYDFRYQEKLNLLRGIADLSLGLRWDHLFFKDRIHLGLNVGWECHYFFDQSNFLQVDGPLSYYFNANQRVRNNQGALMVQGLAFGARLDF